MPISNEPDELKKFKNLAGRSDTAKNYAEFFAGDITSKPPQPEIGQLLSYLKDHNLLVPQFAAKVKDVQVKPVVKKYIIEPFAPPEKTRHDRKRIRRGLAVLYVNGYLAPHFMEYIDAASEGKEQDWPPSNSDSTDVQQSIENNLITDHSEKKGDTVNHPLNQILYGPPGTGKTYRTIDLSVEITGMAEDSHEENHEIFTELLSDQIEFITFHPSYAYEDFIQGLRPDVEKSAGSLSFTWKDGVFKRIADRAKENYEAYAQDNEEELKNYVLIIDEINRANISRVFGELITLIEDDKRMGGSNELEVILPSEEPFSVPPNLYIIGTMNTADKSIALVDIALRRRFVFKRIYPEPEQISDKYQKQILEKLNSGIVQRKGPDFQIGHAYFMAPDNGKTDFTAIMNNKIIPLLYEYFMNDGEVVKQILTESGIPTEKVMGIYEYQQ